MGVRVQGLSLAAILSCVPLSAFDGVVRKAGLPVPDAEVVVLGTPAVARTGLDGRFRLPGAPQPPFEVLVTLPGGRLARPIHVAALPAEGPLVLEVEELEYAESVTVTAGGAPHIESTPAAATTLVSGRDLEARAPATLGQAFENVAGVSLISEGQAAVPAIRGLARGRTLVLIDGARVTAERRVGPSATYLDPAILEALEVSRGPGGVAYGSDAFGGVIDARTRGAVPGSGWGGRFLGALGAGTPERRASLELTHGHERGGALVQGHWREFDEYRSPRGTVPNSGARDFGARARLDRALGPGMFRAGWQGDFGREIERPRTDSATSRFSYPTEDSHRFTAAWEAANAAGWNRLGASAFLGRYGIVGDTDHAASAGAPRRIERSDVSARDFHVRGFAERPLGGARFEAGLEVDGRFDLEALDVAIEDAGGPAERAVTNVSVEDARRTDTGAWAMLAGAPAARVELSGGLRVDRVTTRNRGGFFGDRSTSNAAVSGFAAATVGPFARLRLTGQVARGFRDPVLSDRYYRGPTGRGLITGNPDLGAETSLQLDLALRFTARRWRAVLYGYHYRFHDLIERYESGPDLFDFRNRGRARLRGLELELGAHPGAGLTLELVAHLARGEALDDGTPLDDIPPPTLTLRASHEVGRGFVHVRGALYARDARAGPTEQPRAGYHLLDVTAGLRVTARLEVRAVARNLTDEEYRVSPDRRAVLAPGRSLLGSVAVAF